MSNTNSQAVGSAIKALLQGMGPTEKLYVDSACNYHKPLLWLLPHGPYKLIDECLTCWVEEELFKLRTKKSQELALHLEQKRLEAGTFGE